MLLVAFVSLQIIFISVAFGALLSYRNYGMVVLYTNLAYQSSLRTTRLKEARKEPTFEDTRVA